MGTINSGHNVAVVIAQTHRLALRPVETSISDAKVAVLNAQNHRSWLGAIETCNFDPKDAVLHAKTTDEGWHQ